MDYICLDCGKIFEHPERYEETHGLDAPPFEKWLGCPYCGGAYATAYKCDCCDEWITGEYTKTANDQRICEGCCTHMEIGDED
jgi:DNA-directed RNA polymerase subunit RPC12/RpoP